MRTPLHQRLSFAASGTVSGLIGNGIGYFLLLYYSQVLGLDAALAGLAMMIALIFDAVSDPWIGRWSDGLKHRLGRRHPFLFAAIIPIPVAYYFIWDVPDLSQTGLFLYMLGMTVVLRLSLTMHVVPFNALLPELTKDYDVRTQLSGDRIAAAWFTGTLISVVMYAWWLADSPEYPDGSGILRAEGYVSAGFAASVVVFVCLVYATIATRRHIPELAPPIPTVGWVETLRQIYGTLAERSILAVIASGLFGAIAGGTSISLWPYMQSYFWGFDSAQISLLLTGQLGSAVLAFFALPVITRQRDKKQVLIVTSLCLIAVVTGPVMLSVSGLFFTAASGLLFPAMMVLGIIEVTLMVMTSTLTLSMIADITEHRAVVTDRREEGLLLSTQSFIAKVAGGVGVWTGGIMLTLINFPTGATTAEVGADVIVRLGWLYGPILASFYLLSVFMLVFYRIDRGTHEGNVAILKEGSAEQT
ncbi:MAG: MFS transporter [Pseudomonadota bacterium]